MCRNIQKEENAYADALAETYDSSGVPGVAAENDENAKEQVEKMQKEYGHAMNGFLTPLYQKDAFKAGSTDVGDVSWLTPTAQIHVAAWPNGCPGHSWQNVSCDRTEIGHKAAIHAGKVIAATAIDLIEDTSLLDEARAEFEKENKRWFCLPDTGGCSSGDSGLKIKKRSRSIQESASSFLRRMLNSFISL